MCDCASRLQLFELDRPHAQHRKGQSNEKRDAADDKRCIRCIEAAVDHRGDCGAEQHDERRYQKDRAGDDEDETANRLIDLLGNFRARELPLLP